MFLLIRPAKIVCIVFNLYSKFVENAQHDLQRTQNEYDITNTGMLLHLAAESLKKLSIDEEDTSRNASKQVLTSEDIESSELLQ